MTKRLDGKVAIVTGAAGGIGRAVCTLFAREGARVTAVDVDRHGVEELAHAVREAGGEALPFQCDVSQSDQAREAVAASVRRFGKVHVLVNGAGIFLGDDSLVEELEEATWDRVLGVNLKGAFNFSRYAIPEIVICGGGSVVNVASTAGLTANERPTYASSKGALISMTRCVAKQYATDNVRVNVVCPGSTDTAMAAASARYRSAADFVFPRSPRIIERMAQPEEIASAILFLASEDASYVTAAVFPVDGGLSTV